VPRSATRSVHSWATAAALRTALLATGFACTAEPSEIGADAPRAAEAPSRLEITFKLDERLTRGLYMGDRWVSPPTYTTNLPVGTAVVDARADVVEPGGKRSPAAARWATSDPAVAVVTPAEGSAVRISVLEDGEARLDVTTGGLSRELIVRTVRKEAALLVEIHQQTATRPATASTPEPVVHASRERAGYAVGLYFGRRIKQQRWDVDAEALARGLADALAGTATAEMTDTEVAAVLTELRARDRRQAARDRP